MGQETTIVIKFDDVERHINDSLTKAQWRNTASHRLNILQRLNTQILTLSEKDFDIFCTTIESFFLTIQKKQKNDDVKNNNLKKSAQEIIQTRKDQNV